MDGVYEEHFWTGPRGLGRLDRDISGLGVMFKPEVSKF